MTRAEIQCDPAPVVMLDTEDDDWWFAQALAARSDSRLKKTSRNPSRQVVARVITTPNVASLPARLRFLFGGKIRMMDEYRDPTHISPTFADLLRRPLPQTGLQVAGAQGVPQGYQLICKPFASPLALLASAFSADSVVGDNNLFVLEAGR